MSGERDNGGRFRSGLSGNPKGRPRKTHGVDAAVTQAVQERIMVTEHGRRRRKTKLEVAAAQLANKGASGDANSIKLAFALVQKAEDRGRADASRKPAMTQSDNEIADRVIARLKLIIRAGESDDVTDA